MSEVKRKQRKKMKQHLHPDSSHIAAAFVPLETHVLEGNKEQEGKRTEGTWGKWQGEKKHKSGTRHSKAKNVLKTTC